MASTSFTLFPQLPFELRLKIFHFAMPGPRILGVTSKLRFRPGARRIVPTTIDWMTSDPIPALLHVCHESRQEMLKIYRPSFGIPRQEGKNYVDFNNDIFYLGGSGLGFPNLSILLQESLREPSSYLLDMFLGADYGVKDAEKIQRMIVDIDEDRYGRRSFIWDEIRLFTSLKELTLLVFESDASSERLMAVYRNTLRQVARKHSEWIVPEITVINVYPVYRKNVWGTMNATTALEL